MQTGKLVIGIVAGAAVGAAIGMLFAPKAGAELRKDIADKGGDALKGIKGLKDKAVDLKDKALDKASELKDQAFDLAHKAEDKAMDLVEKGKSKLDDGIAKLENQGTHGAQNTQKK